MAGEDEQIDELSHTPKKPGLWKDILMAVFTVVIVVVVFVYVLPEFASYHEVFTTLRRVSLWDLFLLLLVALANMVLSWTINQASLPGLRNRQSAQILLSQNLIASALPVGAVWSVGMGYAIISSYGFNMSQYSLMLSISLVWNTMARFALPAIALLLLVFTETPSGTMITLSMVGLGLIVAMILLICLALWKRSLAVYIGNIAGRAASWFLGLFHKPPVTTWGRSLARFRDDVVTVTRSRWPLLTFLALLYQFTAFWVFLMALRFSGVPASGSHGVSWVAVFGAFSLARLITAVPITSGSVGIAEASFTSLLIAAGAPRPESVAGVLLFRALTWVLPILVGMPVYLQWFFKHHGKRIKNGKSGAVT